MKKILYSFAFLLIANISFSQNSPYELRAQLQVEELVKRFDYIGLPLTVEQQVSIKNINIISLDKLNSIQSNDAMPIETIDAGVAEIKKQRIIQIKNNLSEIQAKKLDEIIPLTIHNN